MGAQGSRVAFTAHRTTGRKADLHTAHFVSVSREWPSRGPPCFIRTETLLRGARVVYNQSHRRLDLVRCGNDRHAGSGRLLLLFFVGGDRRFQRGQELSARMGDAPTAIIPQHKCIGKNFELWCARGQPAHSVCPIRPAGHQDAYEARQFDNGGAPIRMARQDLQNRNLKTHGTPRDKLIRHHSLSRAIVHRSRSGIFPPVSERQQQVSPHELGRGRA
jgi:hypothetical protein